MRRLSAGSQKFHKRNGGACWYCGVRVALDTRAAGSDDRMATVDHQEPRIAGGADVKENKVTACYKCNQEKSYHSVEEYRALLAAERGAEVIFHGEARLTGTQTTE